MYQNALVDEILASKTLWASVRCQALCSNNAIYEGQESHGLSQWNWDLIGETSMDTTTCNIQQGAINVIVIWGYKKRLIFKEELGRLHEGGVMWPRRGFLLKWWRRQLLHKWEVTEQKVTGKGASWLQLKLKGRRERNTLQQYWRPRVQEENVAAGQQAQRQAVQAVHLHILEPEEKRHFKEPALRSRAPRASRVPAGCLRTHNCFVHNGCVDTIAIFLFSCYYNPNFAWSAICPTLGGQLLRV